jgi:hypothetical protein
MMMRFQGLRARAVRTLGPKKHDCELILSFDVRYSESNTVSFISKDAVSKLDQVLFVLGHFPWQDLHEAAAIAAKIFLSLCPLDIGGLMETLPRKVSDPKKQLGNGPLSIEVDLSLVAGSSAPFGGDVANDPRVVKTFRASDIEGLDMEVNQWGCVHIIHERKGECGLYMLNLGPYKQLPMHRHEVSSSVAPRSRWRSALHRGA